MHKAHRLNTDFQIAYFLAGACHTPDGAYAQLCGLAEERRNTIAVNDANKKKKQAKLIRIQRRMKSKDEAERLEAEAELEVMQAMEATGQACYVAAKAELAFIEKCIKEVAPLRKYAHLPDDEAAQAMQYDEWKLELIFRAQNYLLTTKTIPHDHFAAMRQHPAFKTDIFPAIEALRSARGRDAMLAMIAKPTFELPSEIQRMLAAPETTKALEAA